MPPELGANGILGGRSTGIEHYVPQLSMISVRFKSGGLCLLRTRWH